MGTPSSASGVTWNLSDLFQSHDDPAIAATLDRVATDAATFAATYRTTINVPGGPTAEHLLQALQQLETLYDTLLLPSIYAGLLFSADTSNPDHQNLHQRVEQRYTSIGNTLLFFELEWLQVSDDDAQRLIDTPLLAPYRHHLISMRRYQPHMLSEAEERIINEKDLTGKHAWRRLFTELIASLSFPMERDGQIHNLSMDGVLVLMRHADRTIRERAFTSFFGVLQTQTNILTSIYNTLIQDHLTLDRLRGYPDPMAQRNLSNQIDPTVVGTMMEVVEQNYPLAQDYFRLKAQLLQISRLQIYDQYAPIGTTLPRMPYDDARAIVIEAFGAFDQQFADIATMFFERRWIDAEVRPGKRNGAFCNGYPPSHHPYILCNYTDDLRDAMTLAHELGHGIHFWLSRKQTFFNFGATLPLAETASVFGELLVFETLLQRYQNPQDQLSLLCNKIEDIFATIFRQTVLTRFEQAVFAARAHNRLTTEQISTAWHTANHRYYGDVIEQTPGYELGWSYIPHFINTPFYCYSYVFGELLVLALYGTYRSEGKSFVPRYIALLEAGGSQTPADLLHHLGVDTADPAFWQRGFAELHRLLQRVHQLIETSTPPDRPT